MRRRTLIVRAGTVLISALVLATLVSTSFSPQQRATNPAGTDANTVTAPADNDQQAGTAPAGDPDQVASDAGEADHVGKFAEGDPDQAGGSSETTPGEGPNDGLEAYLAAQRTYPASVIPPAVTEKAAVAFDALAAKDAKTGDPKSKGNKWSLFGPTTDATQPGVTAFSGATNSTASRDTALVVAPDCGKKGKGDDCRVWVGSSGGGVWRTDNGLAGDPTWKQLNPQGLDQNSVGTLTLDPTDKKANTIYLGTGEANRCSSGCEAGVGVYKSTDGGNKWKKLGDVCVSNATFACVTPGADAFLGRAIRSIVIDPRDANHIFVGSAQAVRGLSHTIGNGGTSRLEPGSNAPGLYESFDGGATFTMVWDGASATSFGINHVELDPLNADVVYASAFDRGLWRRDAGAAATAFSQVFAPQFNQGAGIDRLMFALTVKNGHTRAYLTEGTQPSSASITNPLAANFWRTDMADQPAATLLASQGTCTSPDPATHTFPATFTGWQCLTSQTTSDPYFATDAFCTQQCWYDQNVYTPDGLPDTVYVLGSMSYGEQPCNTNGVGCGNGRSNGRAVLYSDTAGDPDAANNMRTFTDLTMDATINHPTWCAFAPYFDNGCENAPNGIHPDEHVIAVNPANPTQIFEGSDGGMIRTSGAFADVSSQCDSPYRNGGGPLPSTSGSYTACQRLLSRVPTTLGHIDKKLSSTLQFIGVAIDPFSTCGVTGGTQDNGTWSNLAVCNNKTWTQVIYGDGGNAGYDATNQGWLFNEYTGGYSDSNFKGGDPERWVITSAPLVNSGEAFAFYWPQISDPNPVPGTHPIFSGGQSVWRTWAFGAGQAGNVPQDTTPDIAGYEANCPEFVTSGAQSGCGDYRPLGEPFCDGLSSTTTVPPCTNQPGQLTGTAFGSDRSGGSISWIARDAADHGTLWVATSAGRIFVTHNADAADPAAVTWHRIDSSTSGGSPTRFPSGIYVDPADTGHAWISYSGYNAATPTTLGHVFDVRENGSAPGSGTFTNLNVESGTSAFPTPTADGDLPVADIVRDDSSGTLYVATDFGVLRGDADGTGGWHVTAGMPRYEVMHLEIQSSSRVATCQIGKKCKPVLYAATHSQGIWQMKLN
jgi:hypothetical protein